nr:60S ribosomal protein L10A [Cryptomonas paramecium]
MSSKISFQVIKSAITKIKNESDINRRNFTESVELQVSLKNYDPKKDKRFSGIINLPYIPKKDRKIAIIGDAVHTAEASKQGLDSYNLDELKKFNKQKKQIKKFAKKYDYFLASESIIKYIPRVLGPSLNKMGKFPFLLLHSDNLLEKIANIKSCLKFELKKVLCMGVVIGDICMEEEKLAQNISIAINFLVSLLKKNWQNINSLFLKSTMGKPVKIY